MRNLFLLILWIIILSIFACCARTENINAEDEIKDGKTKGDQIIQALDKFQEEYRKYPENLSELIPVYILEIPITLTGKEFVFEENKNDIFYLSFPITTKKEVGSGTICTYIKRLDGWDCSQSFEIEN